MSQDVNALVLSLIVLCLVIFSVVILGSFTTVEATLFQHITITNNTDIPKGNIESSNITTKPADLPTQQNTGKGGWTSYLTSLVFDENGIPYYNYSIKQGKNIGLQRNAITIEHEALRFYNEYNTSANPKNETARQFFINNADWLVNNAVTKQHNASFNYAVYEYTFPWPYYNLEPPWQSAMAQGRALIVLVRAHELTGEEKYLDTAKLLLNSFFVEVKDGGVTIKTPGSGWWYEEYASTENDATNGSRVLNGMIFSVLGLYEYYKYTQDPAAIYLFDQGIVSLKNDLPKYDKNGLSLYDALGKPATKLYHSTHIRLLKQLYELTNELEFKKYNDIWSNNRFRFG